MKNDGLSDIERLDLATLDQAVKSVPMASVSYRYPPGYEYSEKKLAVDGAVRGTFTGTVIQTTMPKRQGRGLMSPGPRIFDEVQLEEKYRLEMIARQNKVTELTNWVK